jgi:hypothetical protein
MRVRKAICIALVLALCAISFVFVRRQPTHPGGISGTALEMDLNRKTIAQLRREDRNLHIELLYFPSFESTFEEPKFSRDSNGKTIVFLRSYSSGPFHRKSEQLTNISFTIPSSSLERGETIQFFSGDYDQVFATAKVP